MGWKDGQDLLFSLSCCAAAEIARSLPAALHPTCIFRVDSCMVVSELGAGRAKWPIIAR